LRDALRLSAVHRVEQRLVLRLHDLALDLQAGCQLALLDRQVLVEAPEVLHGLPAVANARWAGIPGPPRMRGATWWCPSWPPGLPWRQAAAWLPRARSQRTSAGR